MANRECQRLCQSMQRTNDHGQKQKKGPTCVGPRSLASSDRRGRLELVVAKHAIDHPLQGDLKFVFGVVDALSDLPAESEHQLPAFIRQPVDLGRELATPAECTHGRRRFRLMGMPTWRQRPTAPPHVRAVVPSPTVVPYHFSPHGLAESQAGVPVRERRRSRGGWLVVRRRKRAASHRFHRVASSIDCKQAAVEKQLRTCTALGKTSRDAAAETGISRLIRSTAPAAATFHSVVPFSLHAAFSTSNHINAQPVPMFIMPVVRGSD